MSSRAVTRRRPAGGHARPASSGGRPARAPAPAAGLPKARKHNALSRALPLGGCASRQPRAAQAHCSVRDHSCQASNSAVGSSVSVRPCGTTPSSPAAWAIWACTTATATGRSRREATTRASRCARPAVLPESERSVVGVLDEHLDPPYQLERRAGGHLVHPVGLLVVARGRKPVAAARAAPATASAGARAPALGPGEGRPARPRAAPFAAGGRVPGAAASGSTPLISAADTGTETLAGLLRDPQVECVQLVERGPDRLAGRGPGGDLAERRRRGLGEVRTGQDELADRGVVRVAQHLRERARGRSGGRHHPQR